MSRHNQKSIFSKYKKKPIRFICSFAGKKLIIAKSLSIAVFSPVAKFTVVHLTKHYENFSVLTR